MLMIDASIQMGEKKCVIILGCRMADLPRDRALILEDLEVLSMRVISGLNGCIITEMLSEVTSSIGKIIVVCSDRGSDVMKGIKDFQSTNPDTRHICDTAHRVSNILEDILEKCPRWKEFRNQIMQVRRKMQNSLVPGALPPNLRFKARYMSIDALINWAQDMLILLEHGSSTFDLNVEEIKKYLGWLFDYRDDILYWDRLISIGAAARHVVRIEGIHNSIVDSFEQSISGVQMSIKEMRFADQLSLFLLNLPKEIKLGERFFGSTEVLESLFGKIKYMEREQKAFGFTSLLLAALAFVGPVDEKTITKAITSVHLANLDEWTRKEIGQSVQSQRKKIKSSIAALITGMRQKISGIFEGAAA